MGRVAALIKEREGGKGEGGVGRGGGTENGMAWGLVEAKEGRERFDRRCSREVPGVQLSHMLLRLLCRRAVCKWTDGDRLLRFGRRGESIDGRLIFTYVWPEESLSELLPVLLCFDEYRILR